MDVFRQSQGGWHAVRRDWGSVKPNYNRSIAPLVRAYKVIYKIAFTSSVKHSKIYDQ